MDMLTVPAQVVGMNPRQDRSWLVKFETRELSGTEVKVLADNFQGEGWLLFKPNAGINLEEIPEVDADAGMKTPSQRLRDVIFILWKQAGGKGDFLSFYNTYMEKLIEYTKSKLVEES